jgi:hypothetical protein
MAGEMKLFLKPILIVARQTAGYCNAAWGFEKVYNSRYPLSSAAICGL